MTAPLRPLAKADIAPLAAVLAELPLMIRYRATPVSLAASLEKAYRRRHGLIVADDHLGTVGLAWFLDRGTFAVGGYLRLLAVGARAAGTGIGARLLAAYEAEVGKVSGHAFLLVSDFNEGAQRFYRKHGYTQSGALPGLVVPDVTELIYWKRLAAST